MPEYIQPSLHPSGTILEMTPHLLPAEITVQRYHGMQDHLVSAECAIKLCPKVHWTVWSWPHRIPQGFDTLH